MAQVANRLEETTGLGHTSTLAQLLLGEGCVVHLGRHTRPMVDEASAASILRPTADLIALGGDEDEDDDDEVTDEDLEDIAVEDVADDDDDEDDDAFDDEA